MKKYLFLFAACLLSVSVFAQKKGKPIKLTDETDSLSYAYGLLVGGGLKQQGVEAFDSKVFTKALEKSMAGGEMQMTPEEAQNFLNEFMQKLMAERSEKKLKEAEEFLAKNKEREGVTTTASGLQYEVLVQGTGDRKPGPNDHVTAHYHGTLPDGTVFDSSIDRGEPFKTQVGGVIAAWQEALQLMTVGTKLRIWCHPDLAYGPRGAGGAIGPNQLLIFDMELISID